MRASASGVKCPKCETAFRVQPTKPLGNRAIAEENSARSASPKLATKHRPSQPESPSSRSVENASGPLGLFGYVRSYFYATRWPLLFWIPTSLLVAAALSFFKPLLGSSGLFQTAAAMATMAIIAMILFAVTRLAAYLIKSEKSLPLNPKSRMAKLGYGGFVCSVAVLILAVAENFAAKEGLLASSIEPVKAVQARLLNAKLTNDRENGARATEQNSDRKPESRDKAKEGTISSIIASAKSFIGLDSPIATSGSERSGNASSVNVSVDDAGLAGLQPKPITSWMQGQNGIASNAPTRSMPEPGGTFSARLTSIDLDVSIASVNGSQSEAPSKMLSSVSEVEAAIGLDGRATASKIAAQNNEETASDPGGTFSEKLIVPIGAKVHGAYSKIQPGGSF